MSLTGQAAARGIPAAALVGSGGGADALRKGPQRMQPLSPFAKQVGGTVSLHPFVVYGLACTGVSLYKGQHCTRLLSEAFARTCQSLRSTAGTGQH